MGILHIYESDLLSKKDMNVFNHPSKKMRLDLSNNFEGSFPNDDLWGAEDLTAEEFDMLEVQATQSHKQDDTSIHFRQPFPKAVVHEASTLQADETKQQLYELEGKVKLLTQALEKTSKELKDEKLNKDKIVKEKEKKSLECENVLRKEIKKVETALQFKDQEMKSVYEKVQLLETQLKEKKEMPQSLPNQTSNTFLKKFKFEVEDVHLPKNVPKSFRKHKLLVDTPKGKIQGTDIVSSILCNRLSITHSQNHDSPPITQPQSSETSLKKCDQLSAVSIVRLNSDQQTEELCDYFSCVFKSYLMYLKSVKTAPISSSTNSPLSLRRKEANQDRTIAISCLKDLACIISSSQFISLIQRCKDGNRNSNRTEMTSVPGTSTTIIPLCHQKTDESTPKIQLLLQLLVSLASPDSYPVNYSRNEEIELSLASLVSWSSSAPGSIIQLAEEIPFHSVLCCYEDTSSLLLSLKLITNLCIYKEFIPIMSHETGDCLLCAIASLTIRKIPQSPLKFANVMLKIEDFLSTVFTVHGFTELKLESSPCSSVILQGVVTSLWKFYEVYREPNPEVTLILKKGFTLVHLLSRYLSDFKERRSPFEDCYISLVCGILTLAKENQTFKEFHDLVHDLWDFQEDTSEFDLDEPTDDSSQGVELLSQNDH